MEFCRRLLVVDQEFDTALDALMSNGVDAIFLMVIDFSIDEFLGGKLKISNRYKVIVLVLTLFASSICKCL